MRITASDAHHLPFEIQQLLLNLGNNIQLSRKRRDMTQAQLAKAMCVTRQTLGRIEQGDPSVGIATWLLAIFCLQREKELEGLLRPENDCLGMLRDIQRQEKRKAVKTPLKDDLDF